MARRKQRPVLPLDRRINVVLMTCDFTDNPVMQIMSSEGYATRSDMTELDAIRLIADKRSTSRNMPIWKYKRNFVRKYCSYMKWR